MLDSGSTSLNELQLEVLDTVIIGRVEAHPGVPVRLVGYSRDGGADRRVEIEVITDPFGT